MNSTGPKPNLHREAYMLRFGVATKYKWPRHYLTMRFLDQLQRCRNDEARRLILGVSK